MDFKFLPHLQFSSKKLFKKKRGKKEKLKLKIPFNVDETLLIDDNLTVLRTAREFGIKHLFAITKPNSQKPNKN